jgi:cupin 2 domain-containing protein
MKIRNLLTDLPDASAGEVFETLLEAGDMRIERIVSEGQSTPAGEWYDQDRDEWVMLLKGGAGLLFEGESEVHVMHPGDALHIPPHKRHRVEWTGKDGKTIWLAVHYRRNLAAP